MPVIKINNGANLEYREYGSGDKILLCTQSFFFSGCHMELLGKPPYDYHCYLVMMRGYGQSDHIYEPNQDYAKIWGEDLLSFADTIGAEKFYYTGISHGTIAGWYTALHQPQRLIAFAPASGAPPFTKPGTEPLFPRPNINLDEVVGNREALRRMSWDTHYPTKNAKRLARRDACRKEHLEIMVARKKEEFYPIPNSFTGSDAQTEEEYFERIAAIDIPTVIINGIHDPLSTPENALKLTSLIHGAKLVTYENFEHAGPDECPETVAFECDRFFKEAQDRVI